MIKTIEHNGNIYPEFQSTGNAARFAIPFAKEVLFGEGYDIGCNRKEWAFPGAICIDPKIDPTFDAYKLPLGKVDYIFSSHCLEHLRDWSEALDYWGEKLKREGVLFLYLPHYSQSYWRSWQRRTTQDYPGKNHIHNLVPEQINDYLHDRGWAKIFVSGVDLNNSFTVIAEKRNH
jgi:hypothetical protein